MLDYTEVVGDAPLKEAVLKTAQRFFHELGRFLVTQERAERGRDLRRAFEIFLELSAVWLDPVDASRAQRVGGARRDGPPVD